MTQPASRHAQRGVTLVIGLIMLVLITLIVTTAFGLSTTNLRSVGNMQVRDEAIAAGNIAIEQEVSSAFTNNVPALIPARLVDIDNNGTYGVTYDGDNDGTYEYSVRIEPPACIRASRATTEAASSEEVEDLSSSSSWNTVWDFNAQVTDAKSGAAVRVRQGIRVLISETAAADANARAACGIT